MRSIISILFFITVPFLGMAQVEESSELHLQLEALDKTYFDAYNSCDLVTQANMYAEDIEFFHDQGGLSTDKQGLIDSLEKNICGKVTRTLVAGSLEVYPIPNYGAVLMGLHSFANNQEPDAISTPSKFVMIWKKSEAKWQITKVISLH